MKQTLETLSAMPDDELNRTTYKLMGKGCWHYWEYTAASKVCKHCKEIGSVRFMDSNPSYTTLIADAWELVEFADSKNICLLLNTSESNTVEFWERSDTPCLAKVVNASIPKAITLCFILAMQDARI